jgi:replication-associated recombination protein RarA
MMPDTLHGLPAMECVSAMQKCIRRAMEREAMEFACELMHTSKPYFSMVCKRLEIISHEDISTDADPSIVPFVATAVAQALKWYNPAKMGASRMAVGNAIRLMCNAVKSREGDHFAIAVGQQNLIGGFVPVVPDWAKDGHTYDGKKMGRGLAYFREHSARLVPEPDPERYEAEAYEMLELMATKKNAPKRAEELFDE